MCEWGCRHPAKQVAVLTTIDWSQPKAVYEPGHVFRIRVCGTHANALKAWAKT